MRAEMRTRGGKLVSFWCPDGGGRVRLESEGKTEYAGRKVWDGRVGRWLWWEPAYGDLAAFLRVAADEAPRTPPPGSLFNAHRPQMAKPPGAQYECAERAMVVECEIPPQHVPAVPWLPVMDPLVFKWLTP